MSETVKISVNKKQIELKKGVTILSAAKEIGIDIPNLCYLKGISKEAACSLCVVEVKGARTLLRACVTEVINNMEIFTDTPRVKKAQRINLELILANHPLDCMTCDKDDDCILQDLARQFGIEKSRFLSPDQVPDKKQAAPWQVNPFIEFNPERCVLCGRCVNACSNQANLEAIGFALRGHRQKISTPFSRPLEQTGCQFCAACVQACPVAALIEKPRIGKGKLKDLVPSDTVCAYCGVGCNIRIYKDKNNELIMAKGIENSRINDGRLCVKGRFGYEYINSGDRLTSPLIKENGKFRKASWQEAIKYTADKLNEIKTRHGGDAIGVLGSSRCTNEDNYIIQKFARAVIGTNNVDNCARLCHSSTVAGLGLAFGAGAATNSIVDITDSDVMFIIGSNMAETHPVIAQIVRAHKKKTGAKIIVCDPRYVGIAEVADIHIQHFPGTDVALLNGIIKLILDKGLENKKFIEEHTEGFEDVKKITGKYDLKTVCKITGAEAQKIEAVSDMIGNAKNMMTFFTMGITQHTTGVDNVLSVANLALLTGNIGRRGAGVMPLRGQANVQGSCDMGALPNVFPGYQKVSDPKVREKFKNAWGVELSAKPGLPVSEFAEEALKGNLKVIYIMGENPLMTEADINRTREGYKKLEFLVMQNIFLSETAEIADVVFPAAAAYEKDGAFTNTDRTVQLLRPTRKRPEGAKFDWEIVCEVATAMGYKMEHKNTREITEEIARLTPSYGGIHYDRLQETGLQWPCLDKEHNGTLFLYENGVFKKPNKKGKFSALEYKPAKELTDKEYPLILTTGRMLYHFHSGNETRRVKAINKFVPRNYVEINPEDARRLKIKDNDRVKASTRRGSISLHARVSERPKKGVIFIPFHFREAAANVLTNPVLDPVSKIPEYKVCAANIELAKMEK
ncbi:MAG: formate dehydrogenase subunit alpha [Candidatus Omnitrophica bacterium]|nr:formate dehydrogenase subunit alpha [Candidatus Omnitrophota bacterium]